ncbi:MAG: hypothetical protein ABL984_08720 [Pyrinomonadaceae bacterium]
MFGKEPTVVFNGLGEIIRAIVPCLILFGFIHWTDQQIAAVFLVVSVVLGFLTTLLTRSQTTPTEAVNTMIRTAVQMPADSTVAEVKEQANV